MNCNILSENSTRKRGVRENKGYFSETFSVFVFESRGSSLRNQKALSLVSEKAR